MLEKTRSRPLCDIVRHGDPERHRCAAHLWWVRRLPCLACMGERWGEHAVDRFKVVASQPIVAGGQVVHAHHLTTAQPKARGLKAGDQWVVPLCVRHHDALHRRGNEWAWWSNWSLPPGPVAEWLWAQTVAAGRWVPPS